ncbi:MAG: 3-hydroxybutyryl-CoA dehydrogenase [Methanoregula sp.]|nr:MAG: 3-hydroxybutyryl-CoA dehydrogenase [Methanoregula sp.]
MNLLMRGKIPLDFFHLPIAYMHFFSNGKSMEQEERILVVGIGTMGSQIALQFAMHGFFVRLFNEKKSSLDRSMKEIEGRLEILVKNGYCRETKKTVLRRISLCTDVKEAARNADYLSESVPDDPVLKAQVLEAFHEVCPEKTVFLSNTSHLVPSQFAEGCGRPERLLAFHFGNPVWKERQVDVMAHAGTAPGLVARACTLARKIDLVPLVVLKEHRGYIMNHIQREYLMVAFSLVAEGVATYKDVDRAWMIAHGSTPPFAIMDIMSLDTSYGVAMHTAKNGDARAKVIAKYLKEHFISKGKLGCKSGEGFYTYPDPEYLRDDFVEPGLRPKRNFRDIPYSLPGEKRDSR